MRLRGHLLKPSTLNRGERHAQTGALSNILISWPDFPELLSKFLERREWRKCNAGEWIKSNIFTIQEAAENTQHTHHLFFFLSPSFLTISVWPQLEWNSGYSTNLMADRWPHPHWECWATVIRAVKLGEDHPKGCSELTQRSWPPVCEDYKRSLRTSTLEISPEWTIADATVFIVP